MQIKIVKPRPMADYGRLWCAKIIQWKSSPEMVFGANDDTGNECVVDAEPGDIIRWGRRNYRNKQRSINAYAIVLPDGDYTEVTMDMARDHLRLRPH